MPVGSLTQSPDQEPGERPGQVVDVDVVAPGHIAQGQVTQGQLPGYAGGCEQGHQRLDEFVVGHSRVSGQVRRFSVDA